MPDNRHALMMTRQGIGMTSQRTRDRLAENLRKKGIKNLQVLDAIRHTPRHLFVGDAFVERAYDDDAFPIGCGQTISQPYTVAKMTETLLENLTVPRQQARVLEIGTGSGYQAAVFSALVKQVYTVERIRELYDRTVKIIRKLEYRNIAMRYSDGSWGWADKAPFDAIIVTAAAREVPKALLEQLSVGGSMIIPVEGLDGQQELQLFQHHADGIRQKTLDAVRFVPFLSGEA